MRRGWGVLLASTALAFASCAGGNGVTSSGSDRTVSTSVETSMPEPSTSSTTTPTEPSTTQPSTTELGVDPPPEDALIFDLDRFDVAVNLRPTELPVADGHSVGFFGAERLGDSTLVANGIDFDRSSGNLDLGLLWTSTDGYKWESVDQGVGDVAGEPTFIPALIALPDGRMVAPVMAAPMRDSERTEYGLAVSWSTTDGRAWASDALIGNAFVTNGAMGLGEVILTGVANPNSDGFTAAVYTQPAGAQSWSETLLEPNGESSIVNEVVVVDETLVAVGATLRTDPIASVGTKLDDLLAGAGPSDAVVWRSIDGATWEPVEADDFTGKTGPSQALRVVNVGGALYALVSEVLAYQTVLGVFVSNDTGQTWERVRVPRPIEGDLGTTTDLSAVGLFALDEALVVIEARTDGTERLFMTIVDTINGDTDSHEISDELGLVAFSDLIALDNLWLGFGGSLSENSGPVPQTVEMRIVSSSDSSPGATSLPDASSDPSDL